MARDHFSGGGGIARVVDGTGRVASSPWIGSWPQTQIGMVTGLVARAAAARGVVASGAAARGVVAKALPRTVAAWVVAVADLVAVEDRDGGLGHGPRGLVAVALVVVAYAAWRGNGPRGQGGRGARRLDRALPREAVTRVVAVAYLVAVEDRASGLGRGPR